MATTRSAQLPRRRLFTPFRIIVVLVLLAAGAWAGINRPWQPKPLTVAVETAKAGPASRVLAVNGRIEPETAVNISPSVSGQIRSVAASEGQVVKAGDLLATLDDSQQRAAVDQAKAAQEAARNRLSQAQIDFERAKSLGDAISRKDLDNAQLAVQTAQTEMDRLTAAREQAQSLLDSFRIIAPFDGTVVTLAADPGQVVSTSTVLFNLADLTRLRAEASIDEIYGTSVQRGLKAKLQPTGYGRTLDGEVSFVSPTVDTSTGGRQIRVSISGAGDLNLPIGLTVNLNIIVDETASALTVPRAAIVSDGGEPTVFVVADGKAERRPISFVDWPSARLIVTEGLQEGDVVIVAPKGVVAGTLVSPKAD